MKTLQLLIWMMERKSAITATDVLNSNLVTQSRVEDTLETLKNLGLVDTVITYRVNDKAKEYLLMKGIKIA